jgi:hypothetical protein
MDNSNIEIINFESIHDEPNLESLNLHSEINRDYLNHYYTDHSGMDDHSYSVDVYHSNSFSNMMNNDSFSSYCSNDAMSCFSETVGISVPNILGNETSDKSINISFDNYNQEKKSKQKRTFGCPDRDCGKVYKSKENLTLHYRNIHLKEKPYSCKYCSAEFSHRNGKINFNLGKTYHERKFHTNYLPHICEIDGKLFY